MIIKNGCYIFSEFEQIIDIYAYCFGRDTKECLYNKYDWLVNYHNYGAC